MGSRGIGIFLIGAALIAGCGDDESGGNTADDGAQPAAQAKQQDAIAKGDVRQLTTGLEACYVDEQDYSRCKEPAGVEPGIARVEKASASTYEVVARSESGNEFRLERGKDGALSRTCTEAETGGCGPAGAW